MTLLRSRRSAARPGFAWRRFAVVAGPGIVVMLADTDVGSVVTAAQSGAAFGYRLLPLQVLLVPVLYLVQDLTVRLGAVTGEGHAALIERQFGIGCARAAVAALVLACFGALVTELGGLAAVGGLLGIPPGATMALAVLGLTLVAATGSTLSVERIALAAGLFELAFLVVAWWAHPRAGEVAAQLLSQPLADPRYGLLVSANIGTAVVPWMVFYQQSAMVERGVTPADLPAARLDLLVGAVLTQLMMAAVLVAAAAAPGGGRPPVGIAGIAAALAPVLGPGAGRAVFGLGIAGAAIVAAIVVTGTAARALGRCRSGWLREGEDRRFRPALDDARREAPGFSAGSFGLLALAALIVVSGVDLVGLSVGVQVMNALLLPVVFSTLFGLARRLPAPHRLAGPRAWLVGLVMVASAGLGLYSGVLGLLG